MASLKKTHFILVSYTYKKIPPEATLEKYFLEIENLFFTITFHCTIVPCLQINSELK
jgi:hypothetical protein